MNTKTKSIIGLGLLVIVIILAFVTKKPVAPVSNQAPAVSDTIKGCYVATLDKDVYTLMVTSGEGNLVRGTLTFKNFEKDSSTGSFTGTYQNGVLIGDYVFASEGMTSLRQVAFKKVGDAFVEGFGEVRTEDNRESFVDTNKINYDTKLVFASSATCGQ